MIDLIPVIATITKKDRVRESVSGIRYSKIGVAINDEYYFLTFFGGGAEYIDNYADVGSKIFISEWHLKQSKKDDKIFYDFIVTKSTLV